MIPSENTSKQILTKLTDFSISRLRYFIVCAIIVVCNITGHSQSLEDDFELFYMGFMAQPSIECEMISRAIDKKDNSVYMEKKVKLIMHNNEYYYDMGDMVCLANNRYVVFVDKANKRMVVGKNDLDEVKKLKKKLIDQNDSLSFKSRGEIVYDGVVDGLKKYRILNVPSMIHQVNISFDAATGYLKKMEYILKTEGNVGISSSYTEITHINTHPVISSSAFDESKYILVKNDNITLTSAYKNYELIIADPGLLKKIQK
jgi:hypothetical protein